MSIFLGYVSASANDENFWSVNPSDFLPFPANEEIKHKGVGTGFRSYSFKSVLSRPPKNVDGVVANVVGLPMIKGSAGEPNFNVPSFEGLKRLHENLQGGYVSMIASEGRIYVLNGYSGEYTAYYRKVGDLHLVSNRLTLLLAFGDAELDPIAGGYLGAHGYIFGRRTSFSGISRLLPGDILEITKSGFGLHAPDLSEDYKQEPASRKSIEEAIDRLVERCTFISDHHASETVVPLSGGKDSRVILGAMCAGGRKPAFNRIFTNGYHYSPEVLSAADLTSLLGISGCHIIRRPALIRPPSALADVIMKSLIASEGQISVFDHVGVSQDGRISVGGHQNGLRDTSLPRFPKDFSSRRPDQIVRAIELDKSLNPSDLLSEEGEAGIRSDFEAFIADLQERGADPAKTPETFGWMVRTAGWVAITNNAHSFSAAPVHPLLDRSLMRVALKSPRHIPESEVIHFLAMARSGKAIWDVPFSAQRWSGGLSAALDELGYNGPRPRGTQPYERHRAFPDASHPYLTDDKRETYRMLSRYCAELFKGVAHKLPWIKEDSFRYICREDAPETLLLAIAQKGVFASILLAHYGRNLFRQSKREEISAEIGSYAPMQQSANEMEILQAHVIKMENSIAEFVKERRSEVQDQAAAKPIPAGKGAWRYAEIANCTDADMTYRLRKVGDEKFQRDRIVAAGTVFTHGVRTDGDFEIVAETESGVVEKTFSFGTGDYARLVLVP